LNERLQFPQYFKMPWYYVRMILNWMGQFCVSFPGQKAVQFVYPLRLHPTLELNYWHNEVSSSVTDFSDSRNVQSGSNMTGTNCDLFTHNQSRSYLNHLVHNKV
jgi:hypothetical protein